MRYIAVRRGLRAVLAPSLLIALFSGCAGWAEETCPEPMNADLAQATEAGDRSTGWNCAERWVWAMTQRGEIADFDKLYGKLLQPDKDDPDWHSRSQPRELRPGFFQDVLGGKPFGAAMHPNGLRISGALVSEPVTLQNVTSERDFWLDGSRILEHWDLVDAHFKQILSFTSSAFLGGLSLVRLHADKKLYIPFSRFDGFEISESFIDTDLYALQTTFRNDFKIEDTSVQNSVYMDETTLDCPEDDQGCILLSRLDVRGDMSFDSAKLFGNALFHDLDVGGNTTFENVRAFALMMTADLDGRLDLGSSLSGFINLDGSSVTGDAVLDGASMGALSLNEARIGGNLGLSGINPEQVTPEAEMPGGTPDEGGTPGEGGTPEPKAPVEGRTGATTAEDPAVGTGGDTSAEVAAELGDPDAVLSFEDLSVGGHASLEGARFGRLHGQGAEIGDGLNMSRARFAQDVDLKGLSVGELLLLQDTDFGGNVDLTDVVVGGELDLTGAHIARDFNLTGAHIGGQFHLGESTRPMGWDRGSKLILRNAEVETIQDHRIGNAEDWPGTLELAGFTYQRLGGYIANDTMRTRGSDWYIGWLEKDEHYSPQPYRQLAAVFRAAGEDQKASDILFASRDRELRKEWQAALEAFGPAETSVSTPAAGGTEPEPGSPRSLLDGLWHLKAAFELAVPRLSIGYGIGHGYWLAVLWATVVSFFGAWALLSANIPGHVRRSRAWYWWTSIDWMFPLVTFDDEHPKLVTQLNGWRLNYFYLQAIVGYVLAAFIAAGIGGLTQGR